MAPVITCPDPWTETLSSPDPVTIDYSQNPATATDDTDSAPTITYSPATLEVNEDNVGDSIVVTATAEDSDGNQVNCQFMITIEGIISLQVIWIL